MKKGRLYIVDWIDHTGNAGWIEDIDIEEPVKCRTVGWFITETQESYKIADTISTEDDIAGLSVIIKSCVTNIQELIVDDESRKKTS